MGEYKGLIIGTRLGHRCGYVVFPKEISSDQINQLNIEDIHVHGGVTYQNNGIVDMYDDSYVIGFDCAHCGDGRDMDLINLLNEDTKVREMMEYITGLDDDVARDTDYVENEIRSMMAQIEDVMENKQD